MKYSVYYRQPGSVNTLHDNIEGASRQDVVAVLKERGCQVLQIESSRADSWWSSIKGFWKKINSLDVHAPRWGANATELALLFDVWRALYTAGVPMGQTVGLSAQETPNYWLRNRLRSVSERLGKGEKLADSMSAHYDGDKCGRVFKPLMVETIRVGEESGHLKESLARLAKTYTRIADTSRKVVTALVYPAFTVVVAIAVGMLLAWIIPESLDKFVGKGQIDKFKESLPFAIRTLFYIHDNPIAFLFPPLVVGAIVLMVWRLWRYRGPRYWMTWTLRWVPVAGKLVRNLALVRFLEVFIANRESGLTTAQNLELVERSVNDAIFEKSVARVREEVRKGSTLSDAMNGEKEEKIYPGLVRQMVRAGEKSGDLASMILPIIDFYEKQADAALTRMTELVMPVMIVILGCMIGPVVLGVYKTITMMETALIGTLGG